MKKLFDITVLVAAIFCMVMWGCKKDDEFAGMKVPSVMFTTDSIFVDLNLLEKPSVIGVVNSEVGLKSVELFIVKGSVETPFEEKVTKFFNPHSHSFNYMPVYQEDYTGLKVLATDKAGNQTKAILKIGIYGVVDAPIITFSLPKVDVYESREHEAPPFSVTIGSIPGLKYVQMFNIVDNREIPITDSIDAFFPSAHNFLLNSSIVADLQYQLGSTAFKVIAVDIYGKIKIEKLDINYVELPLPQIAINESSITADEETNVPFSGRITSESGLVQVDVYAKTLDDSTLVHSYNTFDATNRHDFDFKDTLKLVSSDVKAIVIHAIDDLNKKGSLYYPVSINELYPGPSLSITSDTLLVGLDLGAEVPFKADISAGNKVKEVLLLSHYLNGRVVTKTISVVGTPSTYTLNSSVTVESDSIIAFSVVAVDMKNKKATRKLQATVGFYEFKNVKMNNNTKLNEAPGALLSVTEGRCYTLAEAFLNQDKIDFGMYQTTSGATVGALRFVVPGTGDFSTRFDDGTPNSVSYWETRNANTKQMREIATDYDNVITVSDINKLPTPSAGGWVNLVDNPYGAPAGTTIVFVTENGRKGIIKFERVDPVNSYTFWLSIKIKK